MNMELGMRIRALREEKKYTQEEIAQQLGLSRQKLARIETGKNDITYVFLQKFAAIIGCSVNDITNPLSNLTTAEPAFRLEKDTNIGSYHAVSEMLDLFYANKHLYERVQDSL